MRKASELEKMKSQEEFFISNHRVARLATVDQEGQPHLVPIVYAFDGERLYTPIDEKPKRVEALKLRRVRNIFANPRVAILVDDYSEEWGRLAWVQIRGVAKILEEGAEHIHAVALLQAKYPQYAGMPLQNRPIIVVKPGHILSWSAKT